MRSFGEVLNLETYQKGKAFDMPVKTMPKYCVACGNDMWQPQVKKKTLRIAQKNVNFTEAFCICVFVSHLLFFVGVVDGLTWIT